MIFHENFLCMYVITSHFTCILLDLLTRALSFCMLQRCFTHFSTILKIHQVVKEIHYTSNINTCTRRYVHDGFVVLIVVTEGDFRKIRFI